MTALWGFDVGKAYLLQGLLQGMTYGLLAVGLVLVFRSSRFINFAQISVGLFGGVIMALAFNRFGIPYWPALLVGMAVAAGLSIATEVIIVRKLESSPKVLSMVATLGISTFLYFTSLSIYSDGLQSASFPQPTMFPSFDVDALKINNYDTAQLILSPLLLLALGLFLARSRYGIAIRAAASNPDAAALAGVSPRSMSLLSWGLAGALSGFGAAMLIPTKGAITPDAIGPDLLLRSLAAAAIGRFKSIPIALASAIGIGVVEAVFATNSSANGYVEVAIFVAVLVSILATPRQGREPAEPWTNLGVDTRLPVAYRNIAVIRWAPAALGGLAVVAAAIAPRWMSNALALDMTQVLALALVGVSVTVITGLGGQLSLGQFAFGAVGATVSIFVADWSGQFTVGLIAGSLAAGVVSAVIGIPALRVRGLLLGVATLSFSLVVSGFLLRRSFMLGASGRETLQPAYEPLDGASRSYYYVALIGLVVGLLLARNVRAGAFGRKLVAVRDNTDAARALTVPATRVKLEGYVVAGVLAGLGGAIYGQSFGLMSPETFPVQLSVDAVTVAAVGGIGTLVGPVVGAMYLFGSKALFDITSNEALAGLSSVWLVLLTYQPRGIMGVVGTVTRRITDLIARLHGVDPVTARHQAPTTAEITSVPLFAEAVAPGGGNGTSAPGSILEVSGLTRRFGGLIAVDDVSFAVGRGEILGLIGPNGAGKTTLFELIAGFTKADGGRVLYEGDDVTSLSPEQRSRRGMVRSFQSATLFPTLTLLDTLMVAKERRVPSHLWESVLGLTGSERRREDEARALIDTFGLSAWTDTPVGVLPTGTRRMIELASVVALEPRLILLDEPSAGIAQSESEALGRVLNAIHAAYGVTFVIIEHDMPLLSAICHRMVAMEVGRVIAIGTPQEVQNHPSVVEAYLGTNTVAVARSGQLNP